MQQRNGNDELSRVTFIVSIIVYVLSILFNSSLFYLLALCGIIYSLFRMLSRNISARQKENQRFLQFFRLQKKRVSMRKEYRIFTCKGCGQHIRVPRKSGSYLSYLWAKSDSSDMMTTLDKNENSSVGESIVCTAAAQSDRPEKMIPQAELLL